MISHRERMQACIRGETSLDHTPVALWRHFPVDDQDPETLAAATIDFQRHYDFDLVKVTPASSFCLKDWGAQDTWEGSTEGTRRYTSRVIQSPKDWEKLEVLDPLRSAHLTGQLQCLKMIHSRLDPETPFIQTIFSPLAQAKNLAGGETLVSHIRLHPEAVMKGLEKITVSTCAFVEAAMDTGIDGIFYAVQHAQAGILTVDEYKTFGIPFDLKIMHTFSGLWCNMLHLHGRDVYFDMILTTLNSGKVFSMVNWHDRETPPSLADAQNTYDISLCGGINQNTMVYEGVDKVQEEAEDALKQTRGHHFVLGTGCVVPIIAPHGNIRMAIDSARKGA